MDPADQPPIKDKHVCTLLSTCRINIFIPISDFSDGNFSTYLTSAHQLNLAPTGYTLDDSLGAQGGGFHSPYLASATSPTDGSLPAGTLFTAVSAVTPTMLSPAHHHQFGEQSATHFATLGHPAPQIDTGTLRLGQLAGGMRGQTIGRCGLGANNLPHKKLVSSRSIGS